MFSGASKWWNTEEQISVGWVVFPCVSGRGLTYKDSGVDIAAGNQLVDMIKPLAKATSRAGNFIYK